MTTCNLVDYYTDSEDYLASSSATPSSSEEETNLDAQKYVSIGANTLLSSNTKMFNEPRVTKSLSYGPQNESSSGPGYTTTTVVKEEEEEEEIPSEIVMDKKIESVSIPTQKKVVNLSNIVQTERKMIEMGELVEPEGIKSLSTYSVQQIAALKLKSQKPLVFTAKNNSFTSLDAYSEKEIEGFVLEQQVRHQLKTKEQQQQAVDFQKATTLSLTRASPEQKEKLRENQEYREKEEYIQKHKLPKKTKNDDDLFTSLDSLTKNEISSLEMNESSKLLYTLKQLSVRKEQQALSHPYFDDSLSNVRIDDLTLQQLREVVRECRAHHQQKKGRRVVTKKEELASFVPLSTQIVSPQVTKHTMASPISIMMTKNAPTILCNINSLPPKERAMILNKKPEQLQIFKNPSTLASKKQFELKLSSSIMSNPTVLSLYHGLSSKKQLSCPHTDMLQSDVSMMEHLMEHHPMYASLLKKHINKDMLHELTKRNNERNVLFIVPGRALLTILHEVNVLKEALAYLIVLMMPGETIPVDNKVYQATNLHREEPVTIRRIDDETLEVDGTRAKIDRASGGRVYVVEEPSIEDLDEPTANEILAIEKEIEKEIAEEEAVEAKIDAEIEAEIKTEEENEGVSSLTEEEGNEIPSESPVIATLPEPTDANALALVPFEEQEVVEQVPTTSGTTSTTATTTTIKSAPVAARTVVLMGVFKGTTFKNRRFETLATKMFNTSYNGAKDMAAYIDHDPVTQNYANQLFLKTFNCDSLYEKYQKNELPSKPERLTVEANFCINHKQNLTYGLDASLQMKEFVLDTQKIKINRAQLMNRLNVVCFKSKKENQYASVSFTLPEDEHRDLTDMYMSADENLLLKFKGNLLQSITINTNSSNFALNTLIPQKTSFMGDGSNVMKHITTQVSLKNTPSSLTYSQFMATVLPLSQTGFFGRIRRRVKAVTEEAFGELPIELDRLDSSAPAALAMTIRGYSEILKERNEGVNISIGKGAYQASKMKKYIFETREARKLTSRIGVLSKEYVIIYKYDTDANRGKFISFNDLTRDKNNIFDAPNLIIELLNPIKKKKELFRFTLALKQPVTSGLEEVYTAKSRDEKLHFNFLVNGSGNLEEIYIRYIEQHPKGSPLIFTKTISKFLASEAYAYKKHELEIGSSYMKSRLGKYLINSGLTKENIDTVRYNEFFTTLNTEIKNYMKNEKLDTLLVKIPDTTMNQVKVARLISSGYQTPQLDETKTYQSILTTGFAPLSSSVSTTNCDAPQVVKLAIREYRHLTKNPVLVKDQSFALYMDRFLYITAIMSDAFSTVNK